MESPSAQGFAVEPPKLFRGLLMIPLNAAIFEVALSYCKTLYRRIPGTMSVALSYDDDKKQSWNQQRFVCCHLVTYKCF